MTALVAKGIERTPEWLVVQNYTYLHNICITYKCVNKRYED